MLINPIIVLASCNGRMGCTDVVVELESGECESKTAILERWRGVLVSVIIISVMHSCLLFHV